MTISRNQIAMDNLVDLRDTINNNMTIVQSTKSLTQKESIGDLK